MATLESINETLRMAAEHLDQAALEIRDLPLESPRQHIRAIGQALANVFQIQHEIYRQRPDLRPAFLNEESPQPDGELTPEQVNVVEQLTDEEVKAVDDALFSNTSTKWRKVARVIGITMMELPDRMKEVPDIYYSQRVQKLVGTGLLESQGNLSYMRYSEVRRPTSNEA